MITIDSNFITQQHLQELKFYIVRNAKGEYFRSKGYQGYGNSWVTDIKKAKVYSRIGPARSIVTYWAGHFPEYGIPDLIEFKPGAINTITEIERVKKSIKQKWEKIRQHERNTIVGRIVNLIHQSTNNTAEINRLRALLAEIDNKNL